MKRGHLVLQNLNFLYFCDYFSPPGSRSSRTKWMRIFAYPQHCLFEYCTNSRLWCFVPGDGPLVVHIGKENELLVDEVCVVDGPGVLLVEVDLGEPQLLPPPPLLHPVGEPLLTLLNVLLAEGQLDAVVVLQIKKGRIRQLFWWPDKQTSMVNLSKSYRIIMRNLKNQEILTISTYRLPVTVLYLCVRTVYSESFPKVVVSYHESAKSKKIIRIYCILKRVIHPCAVFVLFKTLGSLRMWFQIQIRQFRTICYRRKYRYSN